MGRLLVYDHHARIRVRPPTRNAQVAIRKMEKGTEVGMHNAWFSSFPIESELSIERREKKKETGRRKVFKLRPRTQLGSDDGYM